uniref:Uncharacterized protein n=1 Tax=Avena sativa TaxID=4498 RepID=A0ACD5YQ87_AVESA
MCPRATAEHGGAAAMWTASSAQSFGEEEYIDLDLSSCGEYGFRACRSRAAAAPPCADEMLCRGRPHKAKMPDAEAGGGCGGGGRRGTATVAPLQHSHVVRGAQQPARPRAEDCGRKAVRARLRVFFRSLFARTPSCSDHDRCRGGREAGTPVGYQSKSGGAGPTTTTTLRSSIELEKLMDEAEEEEGHASSSVRQRKSFSGVIRWRPLTTAAAAGRSRNSCGSAPAALLLKRSSSCRSESEGLIQGAIAYCKRSQFARKSVGDAAALCSSRA